MDQTSSAGAACHTVRRIDVGDGLTSKGLQHESAALCNRRSMEQPLQDSIHSQHNHCE